MANEKKKLKGEAKVDDFTKGVRKGSKGTKACLLTNLELPMDYHGSSDVNTVEPDAEGDTDDEG